jgi:hypothetical protein
MTDEDLLEYARVIRKEGDARLGAVAKLTDAEVGRGIDEEEARARSLEHFENKIVAFWGLFDAIKQACSPDEFERVEDLLDGSGTASARMH